MSVTKVMIQLQQTDPLAADNTVLLEEKLIQKLNLPKDGDLFLRFGASKVPVKLATHTRPNCLSLSPSAASQLKLRQGMQLGVTNQSGTLVLGPLLGVMMSSVAADSAKPFGTATKFCKELTIACSTEGAFVYFFTPAAISRGQQSSLKGWFYSGGWKSGRFPLPDVIHNRLTSRSLENKSSVQHFMRDVKLRFGSSVFNEKFLNKTEVFRALKKDPSLHSFLPESHLCKNVLAVKNMCQKYKTVFIKPTSGSLGKGIIRVTRRPDQTYTVEMMTAGGLRRVTCHTSAKVYSLIASKLKARPHQIQQGLPLISIGPRTVDFRALVQKDRSGQWAVTSIVARIAGNQTFISNLARGGTISTVTAAVARSNLRRGARKGISSKLKQAALNIANGLDQQINRHFGELGIDLGVDRTGKVWLLEVNSKPSKNEDSSLVKGGVRPSVKRLVQYVLHLSGF
jgi:hypothetical protein